MPLSVGKLGKMVTIHDWFNKEFLFALLSVYSQKDKFKKSMNK
jgi:hypothetical protein